VSKTQSNMKQAFSGESQAYQRHLAYATRAADEYKEGIYKLFHAVAASERIHAQRHLSYMKRIKTTAENLKKEYCDCRVQIHYSPYSKERRTW
jgi:rubrerythrin